MTLRPVTLESLLTLKIPPRELILSPIIPSQGLVMLYAQRGIGKTHTSLSIALAVASGGEALGGKWEAEKPHRVLFVDGEMPAIALQERLQAWVDSTQAVLPAPDYLQIITPDLQEGGGIPDLATDEGRKAVEAHLEGVKLLVLDNLSSLVRQGVENEAESWLPIQGWLLSLRSRGISVLLIHHAGKNGTARGTSKREDLLDTVITLKHPEGYSAEQGAAFKVSYEKARGFYGKAAKPFEAKLLGEGAHMRWEVAEVVKGKDAERLKEMRAQGLTQREMAEKIGKSPASVNRLLKELEEAAPVSSFTS